MITMQTFFITFVSSVQAAFTPQWFADMGDKRQTYVQTHPYIRTQIHTYAHTYMQAYLNPSVWEY